MNGKRFYSAASESQAVIEAAAELGIPPGELAYSVRQGTLRPGRVVIVVDLAAPRRAAAPAPAVEEPRRERLARAPEGELRQAPPTEEARHERRPRSRPEREREPGPEPERHDEPLPATGAEGARRAAAAVVALAGLELVPEVLEVEGAIRVELTGPGRDLLVARHGEVLKAAEYLLRRMVHDLPEEGLSVDSGGFRAEREQALRQRAQAAAEEVRRTGLPVLLEPMSAAERRVVHLAIAEHPGVASASEGEGELKRVRVRPAG